jgi:hypothetical protein
MSGEIAEDAFERGRELERCRCAKIVCPDCAKGVKLDKHGDHVLEWIEGNPYHVRVCLAKTIISGD